MQSYWKTTRIVLTCLAVMAAGFWTSVTYLGQNWSDQWHYVLTFFSMLALILLCAAVLVVMLKLLALLWRKITNSAEIDAVEVLDQPDKEQE